MTNLSLNKHQGQFKQFLKFSLLSKKYKIKFSEGQVGRITYNISNYNSATLQQRNPVERRVAGFR